MVQRIFLIGYMASGKSLLGRILAREFDCYFIDLDDFITQKVGIPINQIFQTQGEEAFRKMEQQALIDLEEVNERRIIISTGGGTPCYADNMSVINKLGTSIFLDCPPEIILSRLTSSKNVRPIIQKIPKEELFQFIANHLDIRRPFYKTATYTIKIVKRKKENLRNLRAVIQPIFNPIIPERPHEAG